MRVPHEKRQIVAVICIIAIVASVTSIILTQRRGAIEAVNVRPHVGAAEVLAGEISRLLNGQGNVVVVTYDPKKTALPYLEAQLVAFKNSLKDTRIQVMGVELVSLALEMPDSPPPLDGTRYNDILSKYPDADAIVSFVGPPALTDREIRRLPKKLPLCLVFGGSPEIDLKQLLVDDIVQVAIVGRLGAVDPKAAKPTTNRQWFDLYFQVVTKENLDALPY